MDLKEISINARNWVDSAKDRDYWREWGIEFPGFICHGVSWLLNSFIVKVGSDSKMDKNYWRTISNATFKLWFHMPAAR